MNPKFIIKREAGGYFTNNGGGLFNDQPQFSEKIEEAAQFDSRWQALQKCAESQLFSGASILPYFPPQT